MTAKRKQHWLLVAAAAIFAALMLIVSAPSGAWADTDDPPEEQEVTDFYFGGIITNEGEPVAGVTMIVEGGGFTAETETDAEGRWRLYVPEKDDYVLTVNEDTLPSGVIVDPAQLGDGIALKDGTSGSFDVSFGLTGSKIINLFLGEGERVTTSFFDQFVERVINGLNFGLLLALAAIGVSLIFGTTGLTNFAHAEMVTFGAVIAVALGAGLGIPMWITIPLTVVIGGLFGLTLDAGLWKPLRRRGIGLVPLMIVSIGLSLAVRFTFQFFMGGSTSQLPGAGSPKIELFGPIALSTVDMMSMAISIVVLIAVAFWLLRTRVGKATRAISDNPGLAAASGINVDRVIRIVWILAAALAALAGILWGYFRPGVRWDMGMHILLLIFAAVTLGGLGTAFGALIGALIVGLLVEVSTLWMPSDLKYVGALVVLILILLVRPQGILGRKERLG
ncbi:branched-chain amino acid ABC transporter permease [Microbacterium koreense]|uniref:Branched-chain amino acid ABC transporter permease n=1 Tax=Microbacterium koreense TaxID=323761 RepID=A0ABW2ZUB2_9MICO